MADPANVTTEITTIVEVWGVPGGILSTLVLFDHDSYGASPAAGLFQGADGSSDGAAQSGGTNGSGTVYRFSLSPAAPVFHILTQSGGILTLTWSAASGQTYQLQFLLWQESAFAAGAVKSKVECYGAEASVILTI